MGRRVAKEAKAARVVVHLEAEQPLIAQVDVLLGCHLDARVVWFGGFEIVQHQHVGIGGAAGLLEAAIGLLQHAFQTRRPPG